MGESLAFGTLLAEGTPVGSPRRYDWRFTRKASSMRSTSERGAPRRSRCSATRRSLLTAGSEASAALAKKCPEIWSQFQCHSALVKPGTAARSASPSAATWSALVGVTVVPA